MYRLLKKRIFKTLKLRIFCNHCDRFYNKTGKSSFNAFGDSVNETTKLSCTDFTENVTSNWETFETTNFSAALGSDAAVYNVTQQHQFSETVNYNVTSHHQSSETFISNVTHPQSTGTTEFPKKYPDLPKQQLNPYFHIPNVSVRQKNSGMTEVSKTNPDSPKPPPQKPNMQPNLKRHPTNYVQTVSAKPFRGPPYKPPKKRGKKKKKAVITRTVYYKPPAGSTAQFIIPDEPNVLDLTDQETPLENTQQPLTEIKINIANKPSSSKTRTVTIEGEDGTKGKVPEATTSQQEKSVHEDTSTAEQTKIVSTDVITNEKPKDYPQPKAKPKSTNKPPFFVQTNEKPKEDPQEKEKPKNKPPFLVHHIPSLADRVKDNMSGCPGYSYKPISDNANISECVTQTLLNSTKQNYVGNFLKLIEDPLSNFPCQDKRTLTLITPTNMDINTQQISKETSRQCLLTSLGAGYKRILKGMGPQIPTSHPQESQYSGVTEEWSTRVRAGVPLSFSNRMMGERLAPTAHDVCKRGQDIVYAEGDSGRVCQRAVKQPVQCNPQVVYVDSDSDWEGEKVAGPPDISTLPDLLLSVYCNPPDDPESRKKQLSVRKNPETQSRPSRKRKIENESSQILPTQQKPTTYVPILERSEIVCSMDPTVKSLAKWWPWEKNIKELFSVTHDGNENQKKIYKNIVEESLQGIPTWTKVTVTGYPTHWDRHKLLDTLINWREMTGLPLTPCFVEFNSNECKFLVCHNEQALYALYTRGLVLLDDDFRMNLSVTQLSLHQTELRFRLPVFLGYKLSNRYDKAKSTVDLTAFLREQDISMMCHFPLNKLYNQHRLIEMKSKIRWKTITTVILAKNLLTTLEGFNFQKHIPSLKELDLSDNLFTSSTQLSSCRGMLSVKSVRLEGNPLCLNYVHQDEYIGVALLLFPMMEYLDGVKISGLPEPQKNFCPCPEAQPIVDRFMELYFNLLESKSRNQLCAMYSPGSVFTLACQSRLKKLPEYENLDMVRACRDVRLLNEMMDESFVGNEEIAQRLASWPPVSHDLDTFTVDVMLYTETSIIFTVTGCLRVHSGPDAVEGPLLDFSRTFVMSSRDGTEYLINNDLWYLAEPVQERKNTAFQTQRAKPAPSLQLENAPDEDLKSKLIDILMKLTQLNRSESQRCLEFRNWDLRYALQYFIELLEVNEVSKLTDDR